ncbi:MAG: sucrose synthase [bacterium]
MIKEIERTLQEHRQTVFLLLHRYLKRKKPLLLRSDLVDEFETFCETDEGRILRGTVLDRAIHLAQEALVQATSSYIALRDGVASWQFLHLDADSLHCREVGVSEFLAAKEHLVNGWHGTDDWVLEVDLGPFERDFPRLRETRSVGRGVEFLNRYLSGRLFEQLGKGDQRLFDFLRLHQVRGQQLMLNDLIRNLEELRAALRQARGLLDMQPTGTGGDVVEHDLRKLGFEGGWGDTVDRIRQSMDMLTDILEAPSPDQLARFLARIPMIFSVVILSPHGYFGQNNVLGMPDTGGQVVYILDQVRALESEMYRSIKAQGLDIDPRILVVTRLIPEAGDTRCDQPRERINGTRNASIIRIPFRDENGEIVPNWISRFKIWPYLERFTGEVEKEILAELGGRPALLVGNYSDGNLVATLLSRSLGVTQCNIAHALEKTKYIYSDLYWQDHEEEHSFACQYTADFIAMNAADFIITSTYQEIAGTEAGVGQYESYSAYSLPGLYRVVGGIDVFDPKFNIVSPGADLGTFFPFTEKQRRPRELREAVSALVYGPPSDTARGQLPESRKPLLFAMSRLDRIKNAAGLVEWFARSPELQAEAQLFLVGGYIDPNRSRDTEEQEQIRRIHELFDRYGLEDRVRWIEMQAEKVLVGELYRFVADTGGVFVQPALFEAFGLTVIEAMSSGLPTFATRYGGPLESIEHGVSGFHLDPNHGDEAARQMAEFLSSASQDPRIWQEISEGSLQRVAERYTWKLYAKQMLSLSRIYGFWRYITDIEREETQRYLDMFYGLMYRPLASRVLSGATATEPGRQPRLVFP